MHTKAHLRTHQTSSDCELCRRKFLQRIISSVVLCLRKPLEMRISSVVDCLRIMGRVSLVDGGGGRAHGLASRDEQQLLDSGDLEVRTVDELCLRILSRRRGLKSLWDRSGDKCVRESLRPREALSGLSESLLARLSWLLSASGLRAGWEPRRLFGAQESS